MRADCERCREEGEKVAAILRASGVKDAALIDRMVAKASCSTHWLAESAGHAVRPEGSDDGDR